MKKLSLAAGILLILALTIAGCGSNGGGGGSQSTTSSEQFTLTISVASSDNNPSAAGTCSPVQQSYYSGKEVLLTAVPNKGYVFSHWDGFTSSKYSTLDVYQNPLKFNIGENLNLKAVFIQKPTSLSKSDIKLIFKGNEETDSSKKCYRFTTIIPEVIVPNCTDPEYAKYRPADAIISINNQLCQQDGNDYTPSISGFKVTNCNPGDPLNFKFSYLDFIEETFTVYTQTTPPITPSYPPNVSDQTALRITWDPTFANGYIGYAWVFLSSKSSNPLADIFSKEFELINQNQTYVDISVADIQSWNASQYDLFYFYAKPVSPIPLDKKHGFAQGSQINITGIYNSSTGYIFRNTNGKLTWEENKNTNTKISYLLQQSLQKSSPLLR